MHRVLVVDDHVANCLPLVKLFRFAGIEARYATSGPEALDTLAATAPDALPGVILLDIMMPAMDGFEVLRRLRADARYVRVAVLMYTAVVDWESHARATALGAQGYLVKGTGFEALRAEVGRHLPPAEEATAADSGSKPGRP